MAKTEVSFPAENRNPEKLVARVKRDLTWIIFALAAALAAAAATYTLLPK
ncbi:MAG: hypothetical protein WCY82_06595 [Desulfotomaculaceae bacterium]